MNQLSTLKKDLRILFASSLLVFVVYSKDYTWGYFGSTIFWIVAFALKLYCGFLILWLVVDIYRWGKDGFKGIYRLLIFLLTAGILFVSIYGMR